MTTRNDVVTTVNDYADEMEAAVTAEKQKVVLAEKAYVDLNAEYSAHMATHSSTPPPEQPPVTSGDTFVVGAAYGGNADPLSWERTLGKALEVRRTYYGGSSTEVTKAVNHVKANIAAKRAVSAISFKVPYDWKQMASGSGDSWAQDLASKLSAAISGSNHKVMVMMHHEPENDTSPVANDGRTDAGRDNWKNMQRRVGPIFDVPGLEFTVCLMGWHSISAATDYARWKLDACIPLDARIKTVLFDIYETHGTGSPPKTGWSNLKGSYYAPLGTWCVDHGFKWGLGETACVEGAVDDRATWFTDQKRDMMLYGGSYYMYFNTNLNSSATWAMTTGDDREKKFAELLRA